MKALKQDYEAGHLKPNLKNLSRGLNLSCGSNIKIVFIASRYKPALNWNRFLVDLRRGSNSLNSDTKYGHVRKSKRAKQTLRQY